MNTPHVPSNQQMQFAFQTILDNRRHAQNTIRWVKLRTTLLVMLAMISTLMSVQSFSNGTDVPIAFRIVSVFSPMITAVLFCCAFWPVGLYFAAFNRKQEYWQAGLGLHEHQSMRDLLEMQHECLQSELEQLDVHTLLCFFPAAAAVIQMIASVGGWLLWEFVFK